MNYSAVEKRNRQWLGSLPNAWSGGRLFQVADAWTSNVDKHTVEGEQPVRLCNYTDVYKNDAITSDLLFMGATATPEQVERFRIAVGDTLITKDSETADDIGIPAFVEYEAPDLICGYHLAIVRPRPGQIEPKFLFWALKSEPTMGQWNVQAAGVTRVGLRSTDLSKVTIPLPPLDEQRRIADFLDAETAQIDTLIAEQERFIQFLLERRSVALVRILSGAGDPVKLKFLVDPSRPITYGIVQVGEHVEDGAPYIDPRDLAGHQIDPNAARLGTTQPEIDDAYRRSRVAAGDIVVSIGPGFGKTVVIPEELDGVNITRDVARVACNETIASSRYVAWVLKSPIATGFWDRQITGSTFRRLNLDNLLRTPVPLPDIQMQRSICDRLDREAVAVDALIAEAEHNVALSKERRAALVTAAVTGQIDVSTGRAA
jgi:type I restriction enzyme S subunit